MNIAFKLKRVMMLIIVLTFSTVFISNTQGLSQVLSNISFESGSGSNPSVWYGQNGRTSAGTPKDGSWDLNFGNGETVYQNVNIDSDDLSYIDVWYKDHSVHIIIYWDEGPSQDTMTHECNSDPGAWTRCLMDGDFPDSETIFKIEFKAMDQQTTVIDYAHAYIDVSCSPYC